MTSGNVILLDLFDFVTLLIENEKKTPENKIHCPPS